MIRSKSCNRFRKILKNKESKAAVHNAPKLRITLVPKESSKFCGHVALSCHPAVNSSFRFFTHELTKNYQEQGPLVAVDGY